MQFVVKNVGIVLPVAFSKLEIIVNLSEEKILEDLFHFSFEIIEQHAFFLDSAVTLLVGT